MTVLTGPAPEAAGYKIWDLSDEYEFDSYEDFVRFVWRRQRGRFPLPQGVSPKTIDAEVNQGRWIAQCPNPACVGAEFVMKSDPLFYCFSCHNYAEERRLIHVRVPRNIDAIESALLQRPHPDFMSWAPGMTVAQLLESTTFHRSWAAPRTWVTGEIVSASVGNAHWRDNLLETAPAKVTTAGDLVYATGANAVARLAASARKFVRWNNAGDAPQAAAFDDLWIDEIVRSRSTTPLEPHLSCWLPPAPENASFAGANGGLVGFGWSMIIDSGASLSASTRLWSLLTGTTSGADVGLIGPTFNMNTYEPIFAAHVLWTSGVTRTAMIGLHGTPAAPGTTPTNFIGFRATDSGNWFAVSRASGTETATDTTIAPTGGAFTPQHLLIDVTASNILYYIDGVLRATISTNRPTANLAACIAASTQTTASRTLQVLGEAWAVGSRQN